MDQGVHLIEVFIKIEFTVDILVLVDKTEN